MPQLPIQLPILGQAEQTKASVHAESFDELEMAEMLAHHYGDGSVYLPVEDHALQPLFEIAVVEDLINEEGYLTRKGRRFIANYQD